MSALPQGIVSKTAFYNVAPDVIRIRPGFNPRLDIGGLTDLKSSIKEHGVKRPMILCRAADGILEVVDGSRRFAAVSELIAEGFAISSVPALLKDRNSTEQELLIEALVANDGKPLLPIEEAMAFKRLQDGGMSTAEIAKQVGRSDTFVAERVLLLSAAPAVKEALAAGTVTTTLAQQIVMKNKGDKVAQEKLVKAATASKEGKQAVTAQVTGQSAKEPKFGGTQKSLNELGLRFFLNAVRQERIKRAGVGVVVESAPAAYELARAGTSEDNKADLAAMLIGAEFALMRCLGEVEFPLQD